MKSPEQKLIAAIELLETDRASVDEVAQAIQAVLAFVMKTREEIEQNMAQNKGEMTVEMEHCIDLIRQTETRLGRLFSSFKDKTREDLDKVVKQFYREVKRVEDLMPAPADFTEIERKVSEVEAKIPKIPDMPNIEPLKEDIKNLQDDVEVIKKDIKELRKRPQVVSGGGTSALAVARSFKYIFHTEEPAGLIDGANTTYTVENNIWAIIGFTLNGEQIAELPNYTFINHTITFSSALPAAYANKDFEVKYIGT